MATILLTWELGGGLGHLTRLSEVGRQLTLRGHRVVAAVRDICDAGRVFKGTGIEILPAPHKRKATGKPQQIVSYAHILRNVGFGSIAELDALANAWRLLIDLVKPDAIGFDHSPTALLAARTTTIPRFIVGDGFEYPPNTYPLPDLHPWLGVSADDLMKDEDEIVHNANTILKSWSCNPLERLADLYHPIADVFLFTLPLLDPFAGQREVQYFNVVPVTGGVKPNWPKGPGPKVFVYVKAFEHIATIFETLDKLACRVLVYTPDVPARMHQKFSSPSILFSPDPLDMSQVACECDFAVLNGTNGVVARVLQAGKPMLNIPLVLNQEMNAIAIHELGAGLTASSKRPAEVDVKLKELVTFDQYKDTAKSYAIGHTPPSLQYSIIADQVDALLR